MKFVFLFAFASLVLLVPATAQDKPGFNSIVHQLFLDDQKDRGEGAEQLPWDKIAARDLERRSQVQQASRIGGPERRLRIFTMLHSSISTDKLRTTISWRTYSRQ